LSRKLRGKFPFFLWSRVDGEPSDVLALQGKSVQIPLAFGGSKPVRNKTLERHLELLVEESRNKGREDKASSVPSGPHV
jgi:hypothetical protein